MPEETTITVTEQRLFQDYVEQDNRLPNQEVVRLINEGAFPFSENTFFRHNAAQLGAKEFNRCVELYEERGEEGTAMNAMQLMEVLKGDEEPHKEELEELAIRVVKELYSVPDSLDLKGMITTPNAEGDLGGADASEEEKDMLSDERKQELQQYIEKKRILNTISHGAAVHQWTSAYYIASERLSDLDPTLCDKYNKLSALVNYWNWQFYVGEAMPPPVLQGMNKCDIKEKKIEAKALNFPVLIHELSKGVLDFITAAGIPNLPPHELKYIYSHADKYSHEQWHYYFGPTLWRAMIETSDVGSQELPNIISAMAKMDYVDLSNFCIDITFHPDSVGKDAMSTLKKSCL